MKPSMRPMSPASNASGSPRVNEKDVEDGKEGPPVVRSLSVRTLDKGEVFSLEDVDPALNAKMHLVNDVRLFSAITKPSC
jgi:hypothetical protein